MKRGSFSINGIYSDELNSVIQNRPEIQTPKRKVNFREVNGRSGAIPFDEEAYENTTMPLLLFTKGQSEDEVTFKREQIVHHLNHGTYVDFIPYFDQKKVYKVMLSNGPTFTGNGVHKNFLPYSLDLTIKPFKYFIPQSKMEITKGTILVNPSFYISEPRIKLYGTGDSTLTVNGKTFVVKNIQEFITIDSEIAHSYKEVNGIISGQDNKIFTLDYPVLNTGSNTITWSGSITKVEIEPRWKTLV